MVVRASCLGSLDYWTVKVRLSSDHRTLLALAAVVLVCSSPASPAPQEPLSIGTQKQLFVDHRFIESSEGVSLTMNPPYQTGEKLIVADQPWEQDGYVEFYSSLLKEDGPEGPRIRVW